MEMNIEMSVAIAAPLMPHLSPKIKIGARITFMPAPMKLAHMAFLG